MIQLISVSSHLLRNGIESYIIPPVLTEIPIIYCQILLYGDPFKLNKIPFPDNIPAQH